MNFLKKIVEKIVPGYTVSKLEVKQSLYATVIRACKKCGAAGVNSKGEDVGMFCPACGEIRPKPENLGRIWWRF
jgi:hypothetical protein